MNRSAQEGGSGRLTDREVTREQVQGLASHDAVAAFFAYLGYDAGERTEQRAESFGITADSLKRAVTHIETVAVQQGHLYVLLVELKSVTVAHTRAIVNSLRSRSGDFLLVLTSDYERVDFVLVQVLPPEPSVGMAQKQVKARPRVLSVDRRNPGRVALRVLRRLTYTEADAYAQWDKLLSAFDTAEWSEEHFDNRALFSDYYLSERLPDMPEWEEDFKPVFHQLQHLYEGAQARWAGKTEAELRKGLLEPTLEALGFRAKTVNAGDDDSPKPDYELHSAAGTNGKATCLCLTYPWGRLLDGKDSKRDAETPEENPGARVVSLLQQGDVPFAIVTNGKLWRLYSSKTHSMSSRFYQMDVHETLALDDPSKAFRYLKRFESSVEAFRISVRRALQFIKTFDEYLADGKLLASADFQKALRYVETEVEEDDAVPASRAREMDATEELREFLARLGTVDLDLYDARRLRRDLQEDIDTLTEIWHLVRPILAKEDAKLQRLKELLKTDLKGRKVLVFSYFKDTARHVFRQLSEDREWHDAAGKPTLHRMDSQTDTRDRDRVIQRFAPVANGKPEIAGSDEEIDILISTDVLSEGQNLQDCGCVLNYDLHWNPTRMVQRAGRCDRIGSKHDMLYIYNMFPDKGLERLLGLVESLNRKVASIDAQGLLDEPVLAGQTVHPRSFNMLRRIREEDNTVIEEEEDFSELVSNESLLRTLKNFLDAQGRDAIEELPDGIHSGLHRPAKRGMFFYFRAEPKGGLRQHFWRYYDLATGQIVDNRWVIANLIACDSDTPRVVADYDVFDIQEKLVAHIMESQKAQVALEKAPAKPDPLQMTVATVLRDQMNRPDIKRDDVVAALNYLSVPMMGAQVGELRTALRQYQQTGQLCPLLDEVRRLRETYGETGKVRPSGATQPLTREDLRLICFDYISS